MRSIVAVGVIISETLEYSRPAHWVRQFTAPDFYLTFSLTSATIRWLSHTALRVWACSCEVSTRLIGPDGNLHSVDRLRQFTASTDSGLWLKIQREYDINSGSD